MTTELISPSWLESRFAALVRNRTSPSILDVGCGNGGRLAFAVTMGITPFGVEPGESRHAARVRCPGVYIAAKVADIPPHRFDFILVGPLQTEATQIRDMFFELAAKGAFDAETTIVIRTSLQDNVLSHTLQELRFCRKAILEDLETGEIWLELSDSDLAVFMQERYVPGTWSEVAAYEHIPRYIFARDMAAGNRVLDFGCGSGYGTALLAEVALSVTGLDISQDALAYARNAHKNSKLTFEYDDSLAASLPRSCFDLITCFEVIEHIPESMQGVLIANLSRLLAPHGKLVISTPNPEITSLYGENPYHLNELTEKQFRELLQSNFPYIRTVDQAIRVAVFLETRDAIDLYKTDYTAFGVGSPKGTAAFIAVCSLDPLESLPTIVFPDNSRNYIQTRMTSLTQTNQLLLERHAKVLTQAESRALRSQLQAVTTEFVRVKQALSEAGNRLSETEQQLSTTGQQLSTTEQALRSTQHALRSTEQRLTTIEASTTWRAIRKLLPVLETLKQILRPVLRLFRFVRGRNHSKPTPDIQLKLKTPETILDPRWDPKKNIFVLETSAELGPSEAQLGFTAPYVVRPIARINETIDRPKVLHIIPNVFVGGSTQLVIDIVEHLSSSFAHEVITSALWPGGAHDGLTVHHVPIPSKTQLAKVIDRIRPDLVHLHYWGLHDDPWYAAAIAALSGRSSPAIQNVNTPIEPFVHEIFSHYVFVSEYVRDTFGAAVIDRYPNSVIYPGINLDLFKETTPDEDRDNAVGMVYRLERDKLAEDSIDLFIEIARRRRRTKIYIIGGGSLLSLYIERTKQAGVRENFRFTGYVPYASLPGWYDKFAIFVAPVWQESFGQVAPFAMNKGLAVSGYAIDALPEILGSDETLGRNVEETAGIITALLDAPNRIHELGRKNRARAKDMFDVKTMVSRYNEVYQSVLSDSRSKIIS